MDTSLLICGGTVVNADYSRVADVLVVDGVIAGVDSNLAAPAGATIINATGLLVFPGGIDPHTHLSMPFMGAVTVDDFLSGHSAAVAGGTTMHLDFALPVDGNHVAGFEAWKLKAQRGCLDYGLHVAVTVGSALRALPISLTFP